MDCRIPVLSKPVSQASIPLVSLATGSPDAAVDCGFGAAIPLEESAAFAPPSPLNCFNTLRNGLSPAKPSTSSPAASSGLLPIPAASILMSAGLLESAPLSVADCGRSLSLAVETGSPERALPALSRLVMLFSSKNLSDHQASKLMEAVLAHNIMGAVVHLLSTPDLRITGRSSISAKATDLLRLMLKTDALRQHSLQTMVDHGADASVVQVLVKCGMERAGSRNFNLTGQTVIGACNVLMHLTARRPYWESHNIDAAKRIIAMGGVGELFSVVRDSRIARVSFAAVAALRNIVGTLDAPTQRELMTEERCATLRRLVDCLPPHIKPIERDGIIKNVRDILVFVGFALKG